MSGIAGVMGKAGERRRRALERMSAAMRHRGPEGAIYWEAPRDERGWGVALTSRRSSSCGLQPCVDPPSGDALVSDGTIYNLDELAMELPEASRKLKHRQQKAILCRMLSTHGPTVLPSLRGMFALAFWDESERRLLLARDPLGIKPLYWVRNLDPRGEWSFAFASELRALLASGLMGKPGLDPRAVASMVWNGFVVGPHTAVEGVELLLPGTKLQVGVGGGSPVASEFWMIPPAGGQPLDEGEVAAILEEGIRLQFEESEPVAVFLSAGVDSSAVANLAQRASQEPIDTFTLSFEEQELDEAPAAKEIAAAIGARHHVVTLTEERFLSQLEAALDSLDQPTFDGINAYVLSRAISERGYRIAMVGSGGDELFGGYPTYRTLPTLGKWGRRTRWIPTGLLRGAAHMATLPLSWRGSAIPPQNRWAKLPDLVGAKGELTALYQLAYALFLPNLQQQLLAKEPGVGVSWGLPDVMAERLERELHGRTPLAAVGVLEQRLFLGERLLRDNDAASMASAVEQRAPLLDHLLLEAVNRLPDGLRFEPLGRKSILRRIGLRGLDPALFERPKSGFVLPFDHWIHRGLRRSMDETLRDRGAVAAAGLQPEQVERLWRAFLEGARGVYWSRIWALYVLVRWSARNDVKV